MTMTVDAFNNWKAHEYQKNKIAYIVQLKAK